MVVIKAQVLAKAGDGRWNRWPKAQGSEEQAQGVGMD
jgi:hypothetical protein